jgi:hypothetical protein
MQSAKPADAVDLPFSSDSFGTVIRVLNKVKGDGRAGLRPAPPPPPSLCRLGHHLSLFDDKPLVPFFPAQHFQRHLLHFRQLRKGDQRREGPTSLTHKFVVFFVGANPHPFKATADFVAQGAIMLPHADGEAFARPGKFLEIKRRMARVATPKPVIYYCRTLNGFRQFLIALPKPAGGFGGHSVPEGQSRSKLA